MGDDRKRGGGAGGAGAGAGADWDRAPPVGDPAETRAIALMACDNLRGTDSWGLLCPILLALSLIVSGSWIWVTDELVNERKGYVCMGILFTAYGVAMLSKRVRDEQAADLLERVAKHTQFYHQSTVKQLRGTDAFRTATRLGFGIAFCMLFGGIYFMPFSPSSKWIITMMCLHTISCTFVYANQKRNADTADTLSQALHHPM